MNVCIVPARGGSKRIPRKNIRFFAGKPIVAYSIEAAKECGLFDRIIVSTDDKEIAQVARDYGAETPFRRPRALANDFVGTTEVVGQAVKWLRSNSVIPKAVCCIYATAPFIQIKDLKAGLKLLQSGSWQYVFSATSFVAPVLRGFTESIDGGIEMLFPEHFCSRSQDLPVCYHDAAQFYWGRPNAWADGLRVFDRHSTIVKVPHWRVQDIDTEEDWSYAEALYNFLGSYADKVSE